MGPGPAFSILAVILLVVVVGLVVALMILIGRSHRGPKVTEPSCGGCGYAVAGLESMRCPECGANLEEVGIVTPEQQARSRPGLQLTLLTVLWSILALIGGAGAARIAQVTFPPAQSGTSAATFDLVPRFESGNVEGLTITYSGTDLARGWDRGLVQVLLDQGEFGPGLDVDMKTLSARAMTLGGPEGTFDADLVEAWLAADGVTAREPYRGEFRDEIVRLVTQQASGRQGTTTGGRVTTGVSVQTTSRVVSRPRPIMVAQLGVGVLWLLGIGMFVRRYLKARI